MRLYARDLTIWRMAETRLIEAETKPGTTAKATLQSVVLTASLLEQQQIPSEGTELDDNCVLAQGVTRETRKWHRNLSWDFGWKIKVRELFNELMSTYVSNAELQKAQNVTEVRFLKRQSCPQPEQSGTPEQTSFGKIYKRGASLRCHRKWQKT